MYLLNKAHLCDYYYSYYYLFVMCGVYAREYSIQFSMLLLSKKAKLHLNCYKFPKIKELITNKIKDDCNI